MRSRGVCVVISVVAVVAVVAPGLALAGSMADTGGPTATGAASNTSIALQPHPNGDARVRVSTRFVLDDVNDSAAFRGLGREFEAGNAGVSVSTFRWAANGSSVATGRTMNVTNVTRNATVVGRNASRTDVGRLTLSFTWTAFARTENDRLVVGDAFNGSYGTWLPGLAANQTLRVQSPAGYTITRSPAGITNGTVLFEGPTTFEPGSPTVWFERRNPPSTPGEAPDTGFLGRFESIPPAVIGAGSLVIVVAVVVGAYAFFKRHRDSTDDRATAAPVTEPSDPPESPETSETSETTADETPAELLSDEERVERLLTKNGGRMKQASIVDETGWSNAKVSQLLSAMDDADRVDKLRIGRENLISLPGEESAFRNR